MAENTKKYSIIYPDRKYITSLGLFTPLHDYALTDAQLEVILVDGFMVIPTEGDTAGDPITIDNHPNKNEILERYNELRKTEGEGIRTLGHEPYALNTQHIYFSGVEQGKPGTETATERPVASNTPTQPGNTGNGRRNRGGSDQSGSTPSTGSNG